MKNVFRMNGTGFRWLITLVACGLLISTFACQELSDTSSTLNGTLSDEFSSSPIMSISKEEKKSLNLQYFSNASFRELDEIPEYIQKQLPFVSIHLYQKDQNLYFLTSLLLDQYSPEDIVSLKNDPEYGVGSEVWTWNIPQEKLQKLFVKYFFIRIPQASNANEESTKQSWMGIPDGKISEIKNITDNGDILFTESKAEGMMHFTTITYLYHMDTENITVADYQPGRPEIYTSEELEKMKQEEEVDNQTFSLFQTVSDIIWEHKDEDWQESCFTSEKLYGLQYNMEASKKAKGEFYHEIGYFSLADQTYTPILRKWIPEFDSDPFISLELIPDSNHLSIHDWCGFSEEPRTNQEYYFNADEKTIQYMEEAPHTTEETGVYEVVKR